MTVPTPAADALLSEGLHLCQYGERAPGGDETWSDWAQRVEAYLRAVPAVRECDAEPDDLDAYLAEALRDPEFAAAWAAVRERDDQAGEPDHRCAELDCGRRCMLPNDGHQDGDHLFWPAVPPATDGEPREDEPELLEDFDGAPFPDEVQRAFRVRLAAALAAAAPARPPVTPAAPEVDRLCEVMHDAYEATAAEKGWQTNEASRVAWPDVPYANKACMHAGVRALLAALPVTPAGDAETLRAVQGALSRVLRDHLPGREAWEPWCKGCGHDEGGWASHATALMAQAALDAVLAAAPAAERAEDSEPR